MYIAPNSEIYLLKNVPIEGSYEHTLMFPNVDTQTAYFTDASRVVKHFVDYSYLRYKDNTITVECEIEELVFCNYLMFRNDAFENKWFYAFITDIEYVNNKATRIYYDLDVVQTWLFDASVGSCFVEREHSETDNIGDNLIPENLETGEYLYEEIPYLASEGGDPFYNWKILVGTSVDEDPLNPGTYIRVEGSVYQGLYSGVTWKAFNNANDVNDFISNLTEQQKSDAIIGIVMIPEFCIYYDDEDTQHLHPLVPTHNPPYVQKTVDIVYYPYVHEGDGGYIPKNNKVYTSPYTQLLVTDYQGHGAKYEYEYFERYAPNGGLLFNIAGAISSIPQFGCFPAGYKGCGVKIEQGGGIYTYANSGMLQGLLISNLPQCAFTIDSYRAWIAMESTKVGIATDLLSGTLSLANAMFNPLALASDMIAANYSVSGFSKIANTIAKFDDKRMMPPQVKSIGGGSIVFQRNGYGFHFFRAYIRQEFLKIIDEYFTMYGYSTNRVKVPNVFQPSKRRPLWNYVKTIGCRLNGSIPVDDERLLCKIYDNGITFWNYTHTVGDYTGNNSPTIGGNNGS